MSSGKQPARDDLPMGQNSSGEQARLEEAIRQLSIDGGSRPYPQRFNEPDCIFYLRDGFCVYGPRCPFNHPPNPILAMEARRAAAREYPQREGQSVYQYYMRTGMRSFGASCKYHHPRHRGESPGMVMPNIHGYPLRSVFAFIHSLSSMSQQSSLREGEKVFNKYHAFSPGLFHWLSVYRFNFNNNNPPSEIPQVQSGEGKCT